MSLADCTFVTSYYRTPAGRNLDCYEYKFIHTVHNSIEVKQHVSALVNMNLIKMASIDMHPFIPTETLEIINLLQNNVFQFEDRFYKLSEGLAMDSSLSPILADSHMIILKLKYSIILHSHKSDMSMIL